MHYRYHTHYCKHKNKNNCDWALNAIFDNASFSHRFYNALFVRMYATTCRRCKITILLNAFASQQAFSCLFVLHLFSPVQYPYIGVVFSLVGFSLDKELWWWTYCRTGSDSDGLTVAKVVTNWLLPCILRYRNDSHYNLYRSCLLIYGITIVRLLSVWFLDEFEENGNTSVAIKSGSTVRC